MADYDESNVPVTLNRGRFSAIALLFGAVIAAVLTTVWALSRFYDLSQQPEAARSEFLGIAAMLGAGWALSLLLWGLGELLQRVEDILEATVSDTGQAPSAGRLGIGGVDHQIRLLEELLRSTRDLRDIGLLNEEDRAARRKVEAESLVRKLGHDIPTLLREHKWQEARQRLNAARYRFPSEAAWEPLDKQLEDARAQFETHDLELATREVDDLVTLGAWDRAAEVVQDLRQRHPESDQVAQLARRVAAGREKAVAENRAKLMAQAQAATDRHDWGGALKLVEQIIEAYPNSPEAIELQLQIPTLRANVEVQRRQQMEARIRDLIAQQRLAAALEVANELIERYPDSPQAKVLREQLPRLEQRAQESKT